MALSVSHPVSTLDQYHPSRNDIGVSGWSSRDDIGVSGWYGMWYGKSHIVFFMYTLKRGF